MNTRYRQYARLIRTKGRLRKDAADIHAKLWGGYIFESIEMLNKAINVAMEKDVAGVDVILNFPYSDRVAMRAVAILKRMVSEKEYVISETLDTDKDSLFLTISVNW